MSRAYHPGKGLRRFDEQAAAAWKLVDGFRGLDPGVTPSMALSALKRAAPYMGIDMRVVAIVDLLFAWSRPDDWKPGALPVVWPSNEMLALLLGKSVRQVQNLLNKAQALGLISFKDSPNGHRGGRRGPDNAIIWAYGVVLAPIGTRLEEFTRRAARAAAENAALAVLRKRLSAARRQISTLAQKAFDEQLTHLKADEDLALARMAAEQMRKVRDPALLGSCVEQIEDRARRLADAVSMAIIQPGNLSEIRNPSCSDATGFTDSTTTKHLPSAHADTGRSFAKESSEKRTATAAAVGSVVDGDLEKHGVTPAFILAASPDLCPGIASGDPSWGELVGSAERLAAQSGISKHAFHEAIRIMGERGAAASVFAAVQKHRRGEVRRPGAYLRGMTRKADAGELNLGRTLHGLKAAGRSAAMQAMADGSDPAPIGSLVSAVLRRGGLR